MQAIQSISPSATPLRPKSLKFGCRLFAYMTPQPYQGQDEFLRQCLLTGGNSLKRQNQLELGESGDLNTVAQADHVEPYDEYSRKAGWGIAIWDQAGDDSPALSIERECVPTWATSSQYDQFAESTAQKKPPLLLAHLREAYAHRESTTEDTHPLRIGRDADWVLMHHGDVPYPTIQRLQQKLEEAQTVMPAGKTDTEKIACLLANQLLAQNKSSIKVGKLPTEELRTIFQDTLNTVITDNNHHNDTELDEYPGSFNLVLSDGNRILATRYGRRQLHLGTHTTPDGNIECLLATDKMQPTRDSGLQPIDWQPIPNNKLLTLEKQKTKDGKDKIQVSLQALVYDPSKPKPEPLLLDISPQAMPQPSKTKPTEDVAQQSTAQPIPQPIKSKSIEKAAQKKTAQPVPQPITRSTENTTSPERETAQAHPPVPVPRHTLRTPLSLWQVIDRRAYQMLSTTWQQIAQTWQWLLAWLFMTQKKPAKTIDATPLKPKSDLEP